VVAARGSNFAVGVNNRKSKAESASDLSETDHSRTIQLSIFNPIMEHQEEDVLIIGILEAITILHNIIPSPTVLLDL
jgi:hypothetical protein